MAIIGSLLTLLPVWFCHKCEQAITFPSYTVDCALQSVCCWRLKRAHTYMSHYSVIWFENPHSRQLHRSIILLNSHCHFKQETSPIKTAPELHLWQGHVLNVAAFIHQKRMQSAFSTIQWMDKSMLVYSPLHSSAPFQTLFKIQMENALIVMKINKSGSCVCCILDF